MGGIKGVGKTVEHQTFAQFLPMAHLRFSESTEKEKMTSSGGPTPPLEWSKQISVVSPTTVQENAQPAGVPELQLQLHGDPGRPHLLL